MSYEMQKKLEAVCWFVAANLPKKVKQCVIALACGEAARRNPTTEVNTLTPTDLMESVM